MLGEWAVLSAGSSTLRLSVIALVFWTWLTLPVSAAEVVVAVVAPAADGRDGKGAVTAAARRIVPLVSPSGSGVGLSVETYDDPCDRAGSAALAKRIAESGALVVVGHACVGSAAVAMPIYASAGKALIVAGARNGGTAVPGALYLPAIGETQGQFLGRAAARLANAAEMRVALASDRTRWALTNVREATAALTSAGKAPVKVETFAGGDKDFGALSARLVGAGVTHVVVAAFGSEAGLFVADLVKASPDVVVIGTETLAGPEFGRAAGAAASRVFVSLKPDAATATAQSETGRALVEGFEREGVRPTRTALATAAAIEAVAAAAERAGRQGRPVTAAMLAEALRHSVSAETLLGPVAFSADGQSSIGPWRLHRWSGGRLIPVQD